MLMTFETFRKCLVSVNEGQFEPPERHLVKVEGEWITLINYTPEQIVYHKTSGGVFSKPSDSQLNFEIFKVFNATEMFRHLFEPVIGKPVPYPNPNL